MSSSDRTAMTKLRAAVPGDLHEAVLARAEREYICEDAPPAETAQELQVQKLQVCPRRSSKLRSLSPLLLKVKSLR